MSSFLINKEGQVVDHREGVHKIKDDALKAVVNPVHRPGRNVRCESYCSVSGFCPRNTYLFFYRHRSGSRSLVACSVGRRVGHGVDPTGYRLEFESAVIRSERRIQYVAASQGLVRHN